jgi:hypothetical protein
LIKSDLDYFSYGDTSNGVGEGILFVLVLGVVLVWERVFFTVTASLEANLRFHLSITGVFLMILSFLFFTPSAISVIGADFSTWGFALGAFMLAAAKIWSFFDIKDGTLKMPMVDLCQGVAFIFAGISMLALNIFPTISVYCVIVTDITYSLAAILSLFVKGE